MPAHNVDQLARWLKQLAPTLRVDANTQYVANETSKGGVPFWHLFREGRAVFTVLLWIVNFMNILMLYSLSNWLPTLVTGMGYDQQTAVLVGTLLQVGGAIGTFGLANARDFEAPAAAFEDREGSFTVKAKYGGGLWEAEFDHSPLDIVAWRGNYVPFRYNLYKFQCINTVTFDHPDPSIYCVLASPSTTPGTSNMEFGCFPPRWSVAEHTFRPPPFHRNVASEFLGLISGQYIGKADTFAPGSASLHNCMSGHGPDAEAYERGSSMNLEPQFLTNTMVFLFETQLPIRPTKWALETELLERDYYKHWQGLKKHFSAAEKVGR